MGGFSVPTLMSPINAMDKWNENALIGETFSRTYSAMKKFSRKKTALFLAIIYTVFVFVLYGGYVIYRAATFYVNIKYPQRGLQGRVYRFDPELGFAPIPNSQGAHVLPPGPNIPIRYNADGFRIPRDDSADVTSRLRPIVLALGCSYTYGDACTAEDAYPYLVGKQISGSSINAGGCGYGLSHMVILSLIHI